MSAPTSAFAALGDPVRATIVDRLIASDATVGELAAMFSITFQAVSQHLDVLQRAELISRHREGRTRRVHLEAGALAEASQWMSSRRARLAERYDRLDAVLAGLTDSPTDPTDPEELP